MRVLLRMATILLGLSLAISAFGNPGTCSQCLSCFDRDGFMGWRCMYNGSVPDCRPGCDSTGTECRGSDFYGDCVNYGDGMGWSFERHYLATVNPAALTVGNDWVVVAAQISTPHVPWTDGRSGPGIATH